MNNKLESIAQRVFFEEIGVDEFLNECMSICPVAAGEKYSVFVQMVIHYIADSDIRSTDKKYEAAMQKKILNSIRGGVN